MKRVLAGIVGVGVGMLAAFGAVLAVGADDRSFLASLLIGVAVVVVLVWAVIGARCLMYALEGD